jgi:hypothetical protein
VLLGGFFALQAYKRVTLDPINLTVAGKHVFWHAGYVGLASHPDSYKFGVDRFSDAVGVSFVQLNVPRYDHVASVRSLLYGEIPKEGTMLFSGAEYEGVLKKEVLRIMREDPWLVFMSQVNKFPLYFKTFFSTALTPKEAYHNMTDWQGKKIDLGKPPGQLNAFSNLKTGWLVIVVLLGAFLAKDAFLKDYLGNLFLISLNFLFALTPPIVSMPIAHANIDSALLFTAIIYLLFAVVVLRLWERPFIQSSLLSFARKSPFSPKP